MGKESEDQATTSFLTIPEIDPLKKSVENKALRGVHGHGATDNRGAATDTVLLFYYKMNPFLYDYTNG